MKKKFLITLITLCTILFAFCMINASAASSGTCGENLTWTLDDEGTLTISGSGGMYEYNHYINKNSPWHNDERIKKVVVEDEVTNISDTAFWCCNGIATVTIGDGVTHIGSDAFYCCSSLSKVAIGNKVTNIGFNAFAGCYGITRVDVTDMGAWCNIEFENGSSNPISPSGGKLYFDNNLVTELVIPSNVTSIGNYAFVLCSSITKVKIPDSVTRIGDDAFNSCNNLISVIIGDNVTTIGNQAFYACDNLISVTIGNNVTAVGNEAFRNCRKLSKIEITDINAWCNIEFKSSQANPLYYANKLYCNGELLTSLVISNDVKSIGNYAFYNCKEIVNITIGSGIEDIPNDAFYNCSNLKYVSLPVEIKYIRNDAFNGCSNIETVFYEGNESQWNEILFYNRNENITNAKIVYNATKKTYKFETNCDTALGDITDFAIFTMPNVQNDGMTLSGWYDNKSLSGEPVTFPYYGDATTLYAAWTDRTGKTFEDAFIAKANQEYTVSTTENGQLVYFEFVPKLSKEYRFYTTGSKDTYGYLYDSNKSQIARNDDSGEGNNFYISYKLTAGETYYIAAKVYNGTGTFTFIVEEPVDYRINEITIKDMSGNSLQTIPTGTFLATVSFTNVSSSADTVIILAQYTDDGAFKGLMYIQTEDVPTGSTIKLSIPVDNSKGDVAKLKAFCWESFGSLTPMGNSASFPAE